MKSSTIFKRIPNKDLKNPKIFGYLNHIVTYDLLMQDGKEMTEFLLNYLKKDKKDKISLLSHSWGTYYE
ncbi:hypothetical protein H8356DRAFT_1427007 [Neocallimastix lanati (nom. inval.)]|nr:hypothetical protein H8356DRAFT_1427007 [Neocallimastix sp. JGI-2020a]